MAGNRAARGGCTSSLDLGVDWGDVDLVINIGAPKGASRLLQRIGRANHRLDEPSRGVLVPANRFEVLECRAAIDAVAVNAQDTPPLRTGALDVLAQHILGRAVGEPFLSRRPLCRRCAPLRPMRRWRGLISTPRSISSPPAAMRCKAYERFAKIRQGKDGQMADHPSACGAALPHEYRHHRRSRHAEGASDALNRSPYRRPA